ncbi:MAG: hypothetical protein NT166_30365 [Candidatus Aminicenantes bacterium]|nr:hypothetical protein [Candidatus Aminicenantes bacterium]
MKKFIFYPYLFALFPVLFLYTHNIKETRLSQAFPALAISLVFFLLLWGIFLAVLKDSARAGIVTGVFILLFFSYGHLYEQLNYLTSGFNLGEMSHFVMIPVFLILWLMVFRFVLRSGKNFHAATGFLNLMALCLVLINIFNIVVFEVSRSSATDSVGKPGLLSVDKTANLPDVYFIIMDEYAGLESIKKLYDYDNREFVHELEKRGFYVAEKSKTGYTSSEQCVASVLNMRFLERGEDPYWLIQNSQATRLFKEQGYTIFIFPINSRAVFKNSERVFEYTDPWFNDFNLTLLETSMLRFLAEAVMENNDYGQRYRDKILYIFETLGRLPGEKGAKFVYCHLLCPHVPFVFDAGGGAVQPGNFFNLKDKKYYLDQYIYMSKKILETVDKLLKRSGVPPVIVIQSDHGQRGTTGSSRMPVETSWQDIFSAYYLPGAGTKGLSPSISPVNTFRLIFNAYFHGSFPILK